MNEEDSCQSRDLYNELGRIIENKKVDLDIAISSVSFLLVSIVKQSNIRLDRLIFLLNQVWQAYDQESD